MFAICVADLIDYKEAARRLSLSVGSLRVMVSRKQVPHVRLGPRRVKFDPDEIARWLNKRKVAPK